MHVKTFKKVIQRPQKCSNCRRVGKAGTFYCSEESESVKMIPTP